MKTSLTEAIRQQGLIVPGERVLCAISGGIDSMAMLHLLLEAGVPLVCAHFNHGLRGAESDRDAAFVEARCRALDVPFRLGRGDAAALARTQKKGLEAAAREMRYRFLLATARETGCAAVATAHTADDNAETVLLNLLRGAGARGLAGIPPVRQLEGGIRLIRPLLSVTRAELAAYLDGRGIPHVEDSSNASDDYVRNRVRHALMPLLRELNGAAAEHICASAALLRADEEYLDGLALAFLGEYCQEGTLPAAAVRELPRPVAMRVLRRAAGSPGRAHLERLYALCADGQNGDALDLPGMRVTRQGGLLSFGAVPAAPPDPAALRPGDSLSWGGYAVRCRAERAGGEKLDTKRYFRFQSGEICGMITVGVRRPGDRIRLQGRGVTKSLKKLFAEAGIPRYARERVPVVRDEAGVLAVYGFGQSERAAAGDGAAISIEITEIKESGSGFDGK